MLLAMYAGLKEALQLEVIARQAAEAKAQRMTRQHAAIDSRIHRWPNPFERTDLCHLCRGRAMLCAELRIANETSARLQREQRRLH